VEVLIFTRDAESEANSPTPTPTFPKFATLTPTHTRDVNRAATAFRVVRFGEFCRVSGAPRDF